MIKYHLTPVRMVIINKSTNNRCWWGCGEKGTLVHCWYGCQLVYPPWKIVSVQFSSVQLLSCFRIFATHESQHARPPCPSPTPGVHSDSCPSSPWCHPDISSSVVPFSSCPQSLPASESFQKSQLFAWGGQSTGVSALASFLPKKSQGLSPSEWTGWISLQSKGLSRVSLTPQFKSINSSALSLLHSPTLPYMTTGKTITLTIRTLVGKVMSLLFNILSRLVTTFLWEHLTPLQFDKHLCGLVCYSPWGHRVGHNWVLNWTV